MPLPEDLVQRGVVWRGFDAGTIIVFTHAAGSKTIEIHPPKGRDGSIRLSHRLAVEIATELVNEEVHPDEPVE